MPDYEEQVRAEMRAIIEKEGHHHVGKLYYSNIDNADRQRRWEAERRVEQRARISRLPNLIFKEGTSWIIGYHKGHLTVIIDSSFTEQAA